MDHFEGRTDPGWTHHMVLTAAAVIFRQLERRRSPNEPRPTLPAVRAWMREVVALQYCAGNQHLFNLAVSVNRNPPLRRRRSSGNGQMNRLLTLALILAMAGLGVPSVSFAAGQQAAVQAVNGHVSGVARDSGGRSVANHGVRLREMTSNQVVSTSRTSGSGAFSFTKVRAGTYVVELVDDHGAVIAASKALTLNAASASVDGLVIVVGSDKLVAAAAAGARFFNSTAGFLVLTAIGVGGTTAAYVATRGEKSPSK